MKTKNGTGFDLKDRHNNGIVLAKNYPTWEVKWMEHLKAIASTA